MAPALRLIAGALASLALVARAQNIAVTGSGSGNVQTRLEIRDLEKNADQWNLYLLSMVDFKNVDESDPRGFYGVAGVHGVPNMPYDGANSPAGPDGYAVGYCPHNSNLFPGWHRAYVALFEQEFLTHVKTVAARFTGADQARYTQAANTMRIPYWDWAAAGSPVMPPSITAATVTVNTPTGQQTIQNPLLQYDFHPLNTTGFLWSPWQDWQTTLRNPNSDAANAVSNQQASVSTIQGDNPALRSRIYNLISTCSDLRGFGNSDQSAAQYCGDSLEAIHNNIHNDVGGLGSKNVAGGHMTILPLAAFDPVFWLHHANVDRLFALWQGVYPNSWEMEATNPQPTFFYPANTRGDANTFLAPFHSTTSGGQHTTNTIRNWKVFGYDYPEFASGDTSPAGIRTKFNALYNPQSPAKSSTSASRPQQTQTQTKAPSPQKSQPQSQPAPEPKSQPAQPQPSQPSNNNPIFGGWPFSVTPNPGNAGNPGNTGNNRGGQPGGNTPGGNFGGGHGGNTGGGHGGAGGGGGHGGFKRDLSDILASFGSSPIATVASDVASPVEKLPDATAIVRPLMSNLAKIPLLLNGTMNSTMNGTLNSTGQLHHHHNMTKSGNFSLQSYLDKSNGSVIEYTTQVACQPYALNGSYNIYIFLGSPSSEEPSTWATDDNLCGTYAAFGSPDMHHSTVQTGSIPLTSTIAQKVQSGLIPSLNKDHVIPHLKDQIQWRVQNLYGNSVPAAQVPGMQISVGSAHLQLPTAPDEFPKVSSPWTQHTDVTQGKPGGLQPGDQSPFVQPGSNSTYWGGASPAAPSAPADSSTPTDTPAAAESPSSPDSPAATNSPAAGSPAPSSPAPASPFAYNAPAPAGPAAPASPSGAASPASPPGYSAPSVPSNHSAPSVPSNNSSSAPSAPSAPSSISYNPGSLASAHGPSVGLATVLGVCIAGLLL